MLSDIQSQLQQEFNTVRNDASVSHSDRVTKVEKIGEQAFEAALFELNTEILTYLGRSYRIKGDAFLALKYLNRAYIIINKKLPDNKYRLAFAFREICNVYSNILKDFDTSLDYCFKGYKLNVAELNPVFLNNIGSNYISLGQYDNAFKYLKKGEELCLKKEEMQNILCYIYYNFGDILKISQKNDDALHKFHQTIVTALKVLSTTKDLNVVGSMNYIKYESYLCIADIYFAKGYNDLALEWIEKTIQEAKGDKLIDYSDGYLKKARFYRVTGDFETFQNLAKIGLAYCEKNNLHNDKINWFESLQEFYLQKEDYKQAYETTQLIKAEEELIKNKKREIDVSKILLNKEEEILTLENKNRIMQLQKEDLEQFAYIVTHDLKTPISNICNFAGLFKKTYGQNIDEKGLQYLSFIINSGKKITVMLSDLMKYISLDDNDSDSKSFTLLKLVQFFTNSYGRQHKIIWDITTEENIPMREFHFHILLENLIKNAIKFKSPDIPLEIKISIHSNKEEFLVKVADNGIGIAKRHRSQIFEIFKRLDIKNSEGTGIGLSICKKIVNKYGGQIIVDANEPNGSIFSFNIKRILSNTDLSEPPIGNLYVA